jgi:hypothetical protein
MKKMTNMYKTPNGTYRARKYINGVRISKNFTTMKAANLWLKSLMTNN